MKKIIAVFFSLLISNLCFAGNNPDPTLTVSADRDYVSISEPSVGLTASVSDAPCGGSFSWSASSSAVSLSSTSGSSTSASIPQNTVVSDVSVTITVTWTPDDTTKASSLTGSKTINVKTGLTATVSNLNPPTGSFVTLHNNFSFGADWLIKNNMDSYTLHVHINFNVSLTGGSSPTGYTPQRYIHDDEWVDASTAKGTGTLLTIYDHGWDVGTQTVQASLDASSTWNGYSVSGSGSNSGTFSVEFSQ